VNIIDQFGDVGSVRGVEVSVLTICTSEERRSEKKEEQSAKSNTAVMV
jgi:hypothetical protein